MVVTDIQVHVGELRVGELTRVTATTTPEGADVSFQSSDSSIAQILPDESTCRCCHSTCLIKPLLEGSFTLVVTSGECKVYLDLTVGAASSDSNSEDTSNVVADCIKFCTDTLILGKGEIYNLEPKVNPSTAPLTWKSSDERYVTVDQGLITAKEIGTSVVTARNHNKLAFCKVIVIDACAKQLKYKIAVGQTIKIPIHECPSKSIVNWTVTDDKIIEITKCHAIKGLAVGHAIATSTVMTMSGPITSIYEIEVVNSFTPITDLRNKDIDDIDIFCSEYELMMANAGSNMKVLEAGPYVPRLYYVQIDKDPFIFNYKLCALRTDIDKYLMKITNRESI